MAKRRVLKTIVLCSGLWLFISFQALAADSVPMASARASVGVGPSGLPLPRFVSLRSNKVNLRTGPGIRYPIMWVYQRKALPVEILDEFENWRKISDYEGTEGWVHKHLLRGRRSALILGDEIQLLRRNAGGEGRAVARLEPGVVVKLDLCDQAGWCRVEAEDFVGWLPHSVLYGVYPTENWD